jgi:hypothetical protein
MISKKEEQMNIKHEVEKALLRLIKYIEKGGKFLAKEMPLLAKEALYLVRIREALNTLYAFLGLLSPIGCFFIIKWICVYFGTRDWASDLCIIPIIVLSIITIVITMIIILNIPTGGLYKFCKSLVAPKLTIISELLKLTKGEDE